MSSRGATRAQFCTARGCELLHYRRLPHSRAQAAAGPSEGMVQKDASSTAELLQG